MASMTLIEWAEHYLRHRDLFERKIGSIERKGETGLLIRQKDASTYTCLVAERFDEGILQDIGGKEKVLVVTRNLKDNVVFVTKHWKELSERQGLKLVFANAAKNEKWVLVPSGHARVAEAASLKAGLMAMHDAVPEG